MYDATAMEGSMGWLRRNTALWHGSFDLGFGATESTDDTPSFATGFVAERKKTPSRLTFNAGYRYGTQKRQRPLTDERETNENEAKVRHAANTISCRSSSGSSRRTPSTTRSRA